MHPTKITINSGGTIKELSYTCFPVKLFRLVSDEKYSSLWWSEEGSHLVVDVPKFEQEILRNDRIPEEDGFKTITFTSFVRQLNLYGFRKVAVDNDRHIDPREWQRYAHTFFIRGRIDFLDRIRRQVGPFQGSSRFARASSHMLEAAKGYNMAVTQHFQHRGIRLSRKGPKPKYFPLKDLPFSHKIQGSIRKNTIGQTSSVGNHSHLNLNTLSSDLYQPLHAYVTPTHVEAIPVSQFVNDPSVWNSVQVEIATTPDHDQSYASKSIMTIDPNEIRLSSEQWQNMGVTLPARYYNDRDIATVVPEQFCDGQNYLVDSGALLTSSMALHVDESQGACNILQLSEQSCETVNTVVASTASQFDAAQNTAVLRDDVTVSHSAPQFCVINDINTIAMWSDDGKLSSDMSDHIFICESSEEI